MSRRKAVVDGSFLVAAKVEEAAVEVDPSLAVAHPALKKALAYWQARRGTRPMPARADLKPSDMRDFIAHIALIGLDRPDDQNSEYSIRLAGTELENIFGKINGRRLADALPADIAARWRAGYGLVRAAGRPLRFTGRIAFEDKRWLTGETLIAPLGARSIDMLFCAFAVWHDLSKRAQ